MKLVRSANNVLIGIGASLALGISRVPETLRHHIAEPFDIPDHSSNLLGSVAVAILISRIYGSKEENNSRALRNLAIGTMCFVGFVNASAEIEHVNKIPAYITDGDSLLVLGDAKNGDPIDAAYGLMGGALGLAIVAKEFRPKPQDTPTAPVD